MNRYHQHPAVCLILTFLVGLILSCGLSPPHAEDGISPVTAAATFALQQVQGTSRKLAGFDGAGNFLSVHLPDQPAGTGDPAQPGVVHAASDPALPRTFTLPTPLFAPGSACNQTATGAVVLPDSAQQILVTYRVLLGDDSQLSSGTETPNWPFMDVNYHDYAIPVFRMGTGQQTVWICDYDGILGWTNPKLLISQAGGPVTVPAPAATVRPAQPQDTDADGHLVLYNPDTFEEYDFWQATTIGDGLCQSQGGGLTGTAILEAASPSPSLTLQLVPTSVIPPGQATLTITDSHTGPTLLPGLWYIVPITATDGGTQTTSVSLLVGGARLYLPLILKSY